MPFSRAHFPTESTSSRADRKWSRAHCFIVMSSTSVSWLSLVLNREIYRDSSEDRRLRNHMSAAHPRSLHRSHAILAAAVSLKSCTSLSLEIWLVLYQDLYHFLYNLYLVRISRMLGQARSCFIILIHFHFRISFSSTRDFSSRITQACEPVICKVSWFVAREGFTRWNAHARDSYVISL